jgi:hypothetical protein
LVRPTSARANTNGFGALGRGMASSSKRKTTMAKLNRERRLLERRQEKQAKKAARVQAAAEARADSTKS